MNRIAVQGLAAGLVLLGLTALFTPHRVTSTYHALPSAPQSLTPRHPVVSPQNRAGVTAMQADEADVMIDLYGNDLSHAVATYSIDALGSPYEVHSPQTELPRLGSPKT